MDSKTMFIIAVIISVIVILIILFFLLFITSVSKESNIPGTRCSFHRKRRSNKQNTEDCICENKSIEVLYALDSNLCQEIDTSASFVQIDGPFQSKGGFVKDITTHEASYGESLGYKYRTIEAFDEGYYTFASLNGGSGTINIYHPNEVLFRTLNAYDKDRLILTKYNSSGIVQWVTEIRGTINSPNIMQESSSSSISVDLNGDVYVSGRINSTLNERAVFLNSDGSIGSELPVPGDYVVPFLAKYDKDGNFLWFLKVITSLPGPFVDCVVNPITSNVFFQFSFGASDANVYNSNGTLATVLPQSQTSNWALIKFDSDGNQIWRAYSESNISNIGGQYSMAINYIKESIYVTSGDNTIGNSDFTIIDGTNSIINSNMLSTQLWKLDANGKFQWIAPSSTENGYGGWKAIDVDQTTGDIITVGKFGATSNPNVQIRNKDGSIGGTIPLDGHLDASIIAKYSENGLVKWISIAQGTGLETGTSSVFPVSVTINDLTGDSFVLYGKIVGNTTEFYNSDGSIGITGNFTNDRSAIIKYDSDGFVKWFIRTSPRDSYSDLILEKSISVDNCGYLYFTNPIPNPFINTIIDTEEETTEYPIASIGANSTFHSVIISNIDSYILKVKGPLNNCKRSFYPKQDVIIWFETPIKEGDIEFRRIFIKRGGHLNLIGQSVHSKYLTNYL